MTLPAANIVAFHVCPAHGGGIVLPPGVPQVLVGGLPAARLTSQCMCVGPTDVVSEGAATVLVDGLPAAHIVHKTIHGGTLVTGVPSVLIGGPTFSPPKCIVIEGDATFQGKVLRDLFKISTTRSGQALFASMEKSGKTLHIHPADSNSENTDPKAEKKTLGSPGYMGGPGTDAEIGYNPDQQRLQPEGNDPNRYDGEDFANRPPDVALFHEMCHADDNMNGTMSPAPHNEKPPVYEHDNGKRNDEYARDSELRAVGLPPCDKQGYSETSYREERGEPPRSFV